MIMIDLMTELVFYARNWSGIQPLAGDFNTAAVPILDCPYWYWSYVKLLTVQTINS